MESQPVGLAFFCVCFDRLSNRASISSTGQPFDITQEPLRDRGGEPFDKYFDLLSNHSGTVWGWVVGI